jgi:hypothetical protein
MAKPGPHGKDKQRCGARTRHRRGFCKKWPVPGKERCRFHGGLSTGALTDEGKTRSLAAMQEGWRRWLEETRAKKAAGEIDRFPGGRKSGPRWVTPRMWERRQIETMQRLRAEREALEPRPPRRRRGRPSNPELASRLTPELIAQAKAQTAGLRAKLRESRIPILASLVVLSSSALEAVKSPLLFPTNLVQSRLGETLKAPHHRHGLKSRQSHPRKGNRSPTSGFRFDTNDLQ